MPSPRGGDDPLAFPAGVGLAPEEGGRAEGGDMRPEFFGEEELAKRLGSLDGQIAGNVFRRLGQCQSYINALEGLVRRLEEEGPPGQGRVEATRGTFERSQERVVEGLAEARAEMEGVRALLARAGHEREAARAQEAVEKIDGARAARRVTTELLEG